MERYDYLEAVKADVKEYIRMEIDLSDYTDREEAEEALNERLWVCDYVTGNASGSYTFNTWQAEENLCHNMDLLGEALREFGCEDIGKALESAESCDVIIRCYLLNQAINAVLDEIWEESEEGED